MDANQTEVLAPELLTHKQYVQIMTLFFLQHADGQLGEDEFFMLLSSLRAEDLEGDRWVYHAALGTWYRIDGEEWREGTPRGPLLVALPASVVGEFNGCLAELAAIEKRVTPEPAEPAGSAGEAPTNCPGCGAEQPPGSRFCNQCGAAIPEPKPAEAPASPVCMECGSELVPGSRFCNSCGAEQITPAAAESPPPAVEPGTAARQQAFCAGCGQQLKIGATFCSHCGRPVR